MRIFPSISVTSSDVQLPNAGFFGLHSARPEMLISEVLSGDLGTATDEAAAPLRRIERLVCDLEQASPVLNSESVEDLREAVLGLKPDLSEDQKLQVWKVSYRIWNTCVDIANHLQQQGRQELNEDHVRLRQVASDMLLIAGSVNSIASSVLKIAMFFFRTGTSWQKLGNFKLAASCFEKATEVLSKSGGDSAGKEEQQFIFDLSLARSKTAWELSHKALASSLLGRARSLLMGNPERHQELAYTYLHYGKSLLANDDAKSKAESVKYIEQSYEICCEALKFCKDPSDERALSAQKFTILRYIAAGQLQNGNYEGVLKCVSALKASSDHPSTPFLAFKALVGMNRHEEAEKELLSLVCHDKATIDMCVSALGFVIDECQQLDVAKKAFFILQSRFPSNNDLPVKVLEKLLKQAAPSDVTGLIRVDMAISVATDDRTLKGFKTSPGNRLHSPMLHCQKEQQSMHAFLWNSGSDFFQAKDYRTAIKLFEAAMLYLPVGEEIAMRGKALRVLCLCHLGLSQYDRAAEYIDAAERLEPNVACSFLKFKVCLQRNDEAGAANEIIKMTKCSDFEAEYLTLASHEAVACKNTKVAVSAMSSMLSLSSSWASCSTKEVVIFRNLIFLAVQDPRCQEDAVTYLLQAKDRLSKSGAETFLGSGTSGHKEANWFAGCAWNLGLVAAKSEDWKRCCELFSCASDFYALLPDTEDNLHNLQSAFLLTVSALLAVSKDDELKLASVYLEKCRKVHEILLSKSDAYASTSFYVNVLAFDLKGRMKEYKEQLDIMYRCATLPGFKPEYYFRMGIVASNGDGHNVEVPIAAFRSCLNLLLSSGAPDYKKAAIILRKLIVLSDQRNKDGADVLKLYKEANHILVGLGNGEYPYEEVQWLVSTAWNRAALQVKLSRLWAAEQWMKVALDLLNHAPAMDVHRPNMVESLDEVVKQKTSTDTMEE